MSPTGCTPVRNGIINRLQQTSQRCSKCIRVLAAKGPVTTPSAMPIPYLPYTDAQLFNGINLVLPAWALLLAAPRWRHTQSVVTATALVFAASYVATILPQLSSGGLDFSKLFRYTSRRSFLLHICRVC